MIPNVLYTPFLFYSTRLDSRLLEDQNLNYGILKKDLIFFSCAVTFEYFIFMIIIIKYIVIFSNKKRKTNTLNPIIDKATNRINKI